MAWKPLPYSASADPASAAEVARVAGSQPWCQASDLVAAGAANDAAATMMFVSVPLQVRPGHRCTLQGYSTITVHDPADAWHVTSEAPDLFPDQPAVPVTPEDDSITQEFRWTSNVCVRLRTADIDIDLPHRGGVLHSSWKPQSATCGDAGPAHAHDVGRVFVDPFGSFGPGGDQTANAPIAALVLEQHLVPAGSTLHFRVQLAASAPVRLLPGMGYREELMTAGRLAVLTSSVYALNCAGLPPVNRLGTQFDMEIAVPRSVSPGTTLVIDWESTVVGTAAHGYSASPAQEITVTAPTG